jgi:hypothetical protein
MLVGAYAVIVLLTWVLVAMNVKAVVRQYAKDHNEGRLYAYLVTLLILGSLIIGVTGAVVQHVIDSEIFLQTDQGAFSVRYYRR